MQVILEQIGNQYRAYSMRPVEEQAVGSTREEALTALQQAVTRRLQQRIEIVDLPIPGEERLNANALPIGGDLQNHPLFDAWQQSIAELRSQRDQEDGIHYIPETS